MPQPQQTGATPEPHRVFSVLAIAALALAVLLPVGIMVYWIGATPPGFQDGALFAGLLVSLIGVAPLSWGLLRARRCFVEFGAGRLFSTAGISGLRDFAIGTGISAALRPVTTASLGLLPGAGGTGPHQLVLDISSDTLILALFAATIAALSWAMQKAAALAEENNRFV